MLKSSIVPKKTGTGTPPLVPAVVPREILIGWKSSEQENAEKVLTAVCFGMMGNMLSGDAMWLSLNTARLEAINAGVPEATAVSMIEQIRATWRVRRSKNPLSGMF